MSGAPGLLHLSRRVAIDMECVPSVCVSDQAARPTSSVTDCVQCHVVFAPAPCFTKIALEVARGEERGGAWVGEVGESLGSSVGGGGVTVGVSVTVTSWTAQSHSWRLSSRTKSAVKAVAVIVLGEVGRDLRESLVAAREMWLARVWAVVVSSVVVDLSTGEEGSPGWGLLPSGIVVTDVWAWE